MTTLLIPCFIGTGELILIAGLALLLFGGKKLPEMMRGLGQCVKQFKEGMNDTTQPANDAETPSQPDPNHSAQYTDRQPGTIDKQNGHAQDGNKAKA